MKRRARLAAASLVLALGALGTSATSCRGVVVGKNEDGVEALCELLERCYGQDAPGCADLDARFATAKTSVSDEFLSAVVANKCLDGCSAAKICWDQPPVCTSAEDAKASPCSHPQDCCGFTSGLASCDQGTCCVPHAVKCSPTTTCCHGEPCYSPVPGQPATCGGVPPCTDPGGSCKSNSECCSKKCDTSGVCASKNICQPEGNICVSKSDCCEDLDCVADPNGGKRCSKGSTCSFGSACAPPSAAGGALSCTPNSQDACCGHPEACVADESGLIGVCVDFTQPIVLPDGFECANNENCCNGFCDKTSTPICAQPRTCAVFDPSCYPAGCGASNPNACQTDADCCANQCVNGRCTCGISTCHSALELGPPIACPASTTAASCVDEVCALDPFCCCSAWDELCVQKAVAKGCM